MTTGSDLRWWGYVHINNSIQVKRWFGDYRDLEEAVESDFTETTYGPFLAAGRQQAIDHIQVLHEARAIRGAVTGQNDRNEPK